MKSLLTSKSSLFSLNNIRLKKKSVHLKKLNKYILKLKLSLQEKINIKKLNILPNNQSLSNNYVRKKKGFIVLYSICFSFSYAENIP